MNALILLIVLVLFAASLSIWVWTRKRIDAFEKTIHQQVTSHVEDEIKALNAGSIGLGSRFLKLEKELQMISSRMDELQLQLQSNTPYAQAIQLAQKGSSVDEITELCGISQTEAQLLIMMHQHNTKAA
ncbi:MAG: DUF2802 domain-containing protein [Gammaproteobacteria bacterium]|nr:DUF2802 domain-containing protein [Gammaproteobacteria bacterium]